MMDIDLKKMIAKVDDDFNVIPLDDFDEYTQWLIETPHEKKVLAWDQIGDVVVSTVFLGVNTNWNDPHWFETMVFGGRYNHKQTRAKTADEARTCHNAWLVLVREEQK